MRRRRCWRGTAISMRPRRSARDRSARLARSAGPRARRCGTTRGDPLSSTPSSSGSISLANVRTATSAFAARASARAAALGATAGSATSACSTRFCRSWAAICDVARATGPRSAALPTASGGGLRRAGLELRVASAGAASRRGRRSPRLLAPRGDRTPACAEARRAAAPRRTASELASVVRSLLAPRRATAARSSRRRAHELIARAAARAAARRAPPRARLLRRRDSVARGAIHAGARGSSGVVRLPAAST